MQTLDPKTICQVALVVEDLEQVVADYAKLFGVPAPEIFTVPEESVAHTQYIGVPSKTRAKLAVFDLGQLVLEITQPDDQPSSWKNYLETRGSGVHHIAFTTEKRDEVVNYFEENDMPIRHYGEYPGGNYTVFDSAKRLGVFIQVKEATK